MSTLVNNLTSAVGAFSVGDPFELIKGLKKLPPNRWDPVSVDGQHVGTVTKHDLGVVLPTSAWAIWEWKLTSGSGPTSIRIDATAGTKDVKVTLGGTVADQAGRVQITPIVQGLGLKISVKIHFVLNGKATEYRFDGRVSP